MKKIYLFLFLIGTLLPASMYAQHTDNGNTEADAVRRLTGHKTTTSVNTIPVSTPNRAFSASHNSPAKAAGADSKVPTICGSLLFSYDWVASGEPEYGIYSFEAKSPISYKPLALGNNLFALGGGCYHDGRYSVITYYDTMGAIIASYIEYDTETWKEVKHYNNVGAGSIAVDMAYDPVSQNIYGCFINDTRNGYVFGQLDTNTGQRIAISNLNGPLFAIGCTSQGQLYGVDYAGYLVRIDKNTGSTIDVGYTGLEPYNTQSAAFDMQTDRFYWAACTQSTQGLYEVDIHTGKASLIANFTNGEEWGGLYVAPADASDNAPAAVNNLNVAYDPLSTANATVTFTLPDKTFGGDVLTGNLNYTITLNDNDVEMGEAPAGTTVEVTVYNTVVGEATIGVSCSNTEGKSPTVRTSLYLGKDAPAAVENLSIKVTDEGNVITWTPPTKSIHGGYCDLSEVTYRIIRQPENTVIANRLKATTFTDKVAPLVLSDYAYDIIPMSGSLLGETARTEKVLVGDAFEVPYTETFDNESDFGVFTVVDANNDGSSWIRQTDGTAQSYYSMKQAMDDWLITPPIHLTTEQLYRFSMSAKVMNGFPERLEVKAGRGRTPEDMTLTVLPAAEYSDASYQTFTSRFGIEEEGDWYIGFHCITPAEGYRMNIDWIKVEADLLTSAPAASTDFTVTAGEKGELSATVSFTAPTKTISGETLSDIQQLKVYRGQKLVKSFSKPQPGETLSFEEQNLPNGMAVYTAQAVNANGPGLEATAQAFVGIDTPDTPTDVRLEIINDVPTISWTAPLIGANGGYINSDNLTYYIQRGTDEVLVAQGITDLSVTDKYFSMPSEQEELYYYVYASTTTGIGIGQATNILVVGPAYSLPFHESFTNGYLDHSLWGIIDTPYTGTWGMVNVGTMPMCEASDGDNGLLEFDTAGANDESFLYSGKIDIAEASDLHLTFDFYYYPQQSDVIQSMISTNGVDWTTVDMTDYYEFTGEGRWITKDIALSEALSTMPATGFMQIGFRAVSMDGIWRIHMDNITVSDASDGIKDVNAADKWDGKLYDLMGRRVITPRKSQIVISKNGKKYINN